MASQDSDWIFDSVISFVKSPLWKVPITSFINENCVVFDDEDENKLEYTSIHNSFKKIVEEMLSNMLSEIGISEEIFAEACIKATKNPTHKMLLSEIMAVENFLAFKKLMVKRNRELSEEAMQLMKAQEAGIDPNLLYENPAYGGAPSREDDEMAKAIQESLRLEEERKSKETAPAPTPTPSAPTNDEEEMLRRVMEESKKEYEQLQAMQKATVKEEEEKKEPPKKVEKPKKEPKPEPEKEPEPKKAPAPAPVKTEAPKIKAPKALAPIGGAKPAGIGADFDIQKHAEETKKLEKKKAEAVKKKVVSFSPKHTLMSTLDEQGGDEGENGEPEEAERPSRSKKTTAVKIRNGIISTIPKTRMTRERA